MLVFCALRRSGKAINLFSNVDLCSGLEFEKFSTVCGAPNGFMSLCGPDYWRIGTKSIGAVIERGSPES